MEALGNARVSGQLPLGRQVSYPQHYDATVLCAIPRQQGREPIGIEDTQLPFTGEDIWTAYEVSWLNAHGKPEVAIGELRVPCTTPNLVESKSLKLYLNSCNQTRFASPAQLAQQVAADVAATVGGEVRFTLQAVTAYEQQSLAALPGQCIDGQDIRIDSFAAPNADSLRADPARRVEETLHSHLLKSNCRITAQPDWASLMIRYTGQAIDHEALLRYLISFRQHDEFHEPCVEKIYTDILRQCQPEQLTVYARYTRRGGLDINPFRSNFEAPPEHNQRLPRQ